MIRSGSNYELRIERRFSASREAVFDSWTNASEIAIWFAAAPFVVTAVDWAPSEGSPWRVDFGSPSGATYWEEGFFLEVRSPEKLVFSLIQVGLPERRPETVVTVIFEAESGTETLMTFRQTGFVSAELRDGNQEGWESCFNALVRHVSVPKHQGEYLMSWNLDETVDTSAGMVAAGRIGSGPALVLAHGWPWSSFSWHRIISELARRYRVHWYDMPGYGRSDKGAARRTSLDVQGQVFAEMLAHWDLEQPVVVAHDMGGATTLRAHLLHGCDFDRYVLMNVVAMRPWGSEFFDHVGRHVDAFQGLPPHIHRAVVEAYIKGAIVNDIDPGDFARLVDPWLSEEGRGSFYRQFAQADEKYTAEVESVFGDIRCPVKIIWGEDDPWIPLERGKALHALIPQASFETLPGVGHLPQLEAPDLVLERLNAFLSREGED